MNATARKIKPPPLQPGARAWTVDEDAILRARYEKEGAAAMARELDRPLASIHNRTQRLKLYTHRRWTPADDGRLRMLWGELSLAWIARRLERTRLTTYWRARKLGLGCGAPRGMEYVTNAAERAGFPLRTLIGILDWADVNTRLAMSRPTKAPRHQHVVDPQDVDDAVAKWLGAETMQAGARARGMDGETLARWVEESGLETPPRRGGRCQWRVPSETIDQVVAARRGLESVSQAAARIGTNRTTLRRWLLAAGHQPPRACKTWLVVPASVDAIAAARLRA